MQGPIAQVAELLASGSGNAKENLIMCGKIISLATLVAKDWPPGLLAQAKEIKLALTKKGALVKTVKLMSKKTANEWLEQATQVVKKLAAMEEASDEPLSQLLKSD